METKAQKNSNLVSENRIDYFSWVAVFVLVGACAAAFAPSLSASFVNWDDHLNFLNNTHYRGLGAEHLRWMFTTFHSGHYIPLTWLSLGLDAVLWGVYPSGYHFTSIVLHCANAVLCYFAFRLLFSAVSGLRSDENAVKAAALAGALFFAVHPLRAESVCWITARRDLVSGIFGFAALLAYLKGRRKWLAPAFFACAVLARESMAGLALALLVLDVYPLKRLPAEPSRWLERENTAVLREKALFFLLAFFAAVLAVIATRSATFFQSLQELGIGHRAGAFFYGLAFYPWKTIFPSGLAALYEIPPGFSLFRGATAAFFFVAALVWLVWAVRKKLPGVPAALAWYAVLIFPTLGIAQTISLAYDRFSYFSCLSFAALFGGAVLWVWKRKVLERIVLLAIAGIWLSVLGVMAHSQAATWTNSMTLWTRVIESVKGRPNETAYLNRCQGFYEAGAYKEAEADCSAALMRNPRLSEGYLNRGLARLDLRDTAGALADFDAALVLDPASDKARFGRACAFLLSGKYKNAVDGFSLLLKGSLRGQALLNRASAYYALKRRELALSDLDALIAENPGNSMAYANRGRLREEKKLYSEALADYEAALRINPLHIGARAGKDRAEAARRGGAHGR